MTLQPPIHSIAPQPTRPSAKSVHMHPHHGKPMKPALPLPIQAHRQTCPNSNPTRPLVVHCSIRKSQRSAAPTSLVSSVAPSKSSAHEPMLMTSDANAATVLTSSASSRNIIGEGSQRRGQGVTQIAQELMKRTSSKTTTLPPSTPRTPSRLSASKGASFHDLLHH